MRRTTTLLAAAALLLSTVGTAFGADPDPAQEPTPAPVVDPTPGPVLDPTPDPSPDPSVEPTSPPSRDPVPSEPASSAPTVVPSARPAPAEVGPTARPGPRSATDPTGRWIVVLEPGTDAVAAATRQGRRVGFTADRTFRHAFLGYSAAMDPRQVETLRRDPSVALVVPDERIELAGQLTPTGISRVNATKNPIAKIDGIDERVDADVAIVDTGIAATVADLNVAGGYNCSTSNRAAWRDVQGHGTHVAGTVGAIDNGSGVVGVAPGVRLWAVKILDDSGEGLLSWYVCGLDWIAAQRDPGDATRPMFEAVNMSVAKWGDDDRHCGAWNKDILHAAICRLVASGVTVVVAAGNDHSSAAARVPAAYNEVITVSALADTDGKPGGLGGPRCYSWGTYDNDDSFADFSNYGSDVDIIAPGKCIWSTVPGGYKYSSGTSMAAPHVTGAVALLKASRPGLSPAEVRQALLYLGTMNWKWWTDPDKYHEKLLDVSRIGPRGDFNVNAGRDAAVGLAGGIARFPIAVSRTPTSFERVRLSVADLPEGFGATFDPTSVYGFGTAAATLSVTVPAGLDPGDYPITVVGDEHGNRHETLATVVVDPSAPTAQPPATGALVGSKLGSSTLATRTSWNAATDDRLTVTAYELQRSVDGGSYATTTLTSAAVRAATATQSVGHTYRYRVRAQNSLGNWGSWADGPGVTGLLIQDRSSAVTYSGSWTRAWSTYASDRTTMWTTATGARARTTFSGRGVAIVAPTNVGRGSAAVYVDGTYRQTISFRSATNRGRMILYSTGFGSLGTHTIELRASGNGRIDLDAFVILR